jgi:hypothetical protein
MACPAFGIPLGSILSRARARSALYYSFDKIMGRRQCHGTTIKGIIIWSWLPSSMFELENILWSPFSMFKLENVLWTVGVKWGLWSRIVHRSLESWEERRRFMVEANNHSYSLEISIAIVPDGFLSLAATQTHLVRTAVIILTRATNG